MKAQFTLISVLLLSLAACQHVKRAPKPENLIPEKKMVNVLTDMVKLDATISYSTMQFDRRDVKARDLLFKKYNIDSVQLAASSAYYAEKFNQNERIYDSVKVRLEREKKNLDSLKKVKDSIQEAERKKRFEKTKKKAGRRR